MDSDDIMFLLFGFGIVGRWIFFLIIGLNIVLNVLACEWELFVGDGVFK